MRHLAVELDLLPRVRAEAPLGAVPGGGPFDRGRIGGRRGAWTGHGGSIAHGERGPAAPEALVPPPPRTHNAPMAESPTSSLRRALVAVALVVPLVVDPFGQDTGGAKWTVLTLCGLLALLVKGLEVISGRPSPGRARGPGLCLLALSVWAALSVGWSHNGDLAVTRAVGLLGMFGVVWGVRESVAGIEGVRRWMAALAVVALAAAVIDGIAIDRSVGRLAATEVKYASTLFVHNNMAAAYAVVAAPPLLAMALGAGSRARGLLWLVPFAALVLYLDTLGSRAGLLSLVVGLVVVVGCFLVRRRLLTWNPAAGRLPYVLAVVVLAGALMPLSETARGVVKDGFYRFLAASGVTLHDASFRTQIWRKTMGFVNEQPLRGVGAGNFAVEYARHDRLHVTKPHAHNDALQVLAELGLPGLFLFLTMLSTAGWILLRVLAARSPGEGFAPAAGLLGSLVVFVVGGMFEIPFGLGATASLLALVFGLSAVLDGPDRMAVGSRAMRLPLGAALVIATLPPLWFTVTRLPGSFHLDRAGQAAEAGDLDGAREHLVAAAALETGSDVPWRRLGDLELDAGDGEAALAAYREARRLFPHGAEYPELEGDALLAANRPDEAADAFRLSLEYAPNRTTPLFKLVESLQRAGRHREGVDLLTYEFASNPLIDVEVIWGLAWAWRIYAETLEPGTDEWVTAAAASRHFFALFIQDGGAARREETYEAFKYMTHRLQTETVPGDVETSLERWWAAYHDVWLAEHGWDMPYTALYTAMDADGEKLFPGWHEPEGPPPPREMRH